MQITAQPDQVAPRDKSKEIAIKYRTDAFTSREVLLQLSADWSPWAFQIVRYDNEAKVRGWSNYEAKDEADALAHFGIYRDAAGKLAA